MTTFSLPKKPAVGGTLASESKNSENAADTAQRERELEGQKQKDEGERRRQNSDFVPDGK